MSINSVFKIHYKRPNASKTINYIITFHNILKGAVIAN